MPVLDRRYRNCYIGSDGNEYCTNSAWNDWVRWIVLAVVVIGFFLLFVLCSCFTARRRRRAGQTPMYGTGWAAGRAPAPYYNSNSQPYYNSQAAPPYTPAPNNTYFEGQNQGYYGQQNGVELQSPMPAHYGARGGDNVYSPPSGPPPGKEDGIIR
ncbi:hypothetical protein K432DRAFT_431743 [Lepidopterella palustris CBS 459.81]|uniref:Chitin synthesis regulation, Congo red resistance, RCR protein n=1 Tax=Lepidopterella palustris CBS 459.81 TaxID=1314670 RepID=A0A8E2JKB0_9PEZI|nr:hypothetical protein K432DRAFT_431743 [Lepidopterella palustris CBS 459.81]